MENLFWVSLAFSTRNQTSKDYMERKAPRNIPKLPYSSFLPPCLTKRIPQNKGSRSLEGGLRLGVSREWGQELYVKHKLEEGKKQCLTLIRLSLSY